MGSRIIMTTRIQAIADKFCSSNYASVYELKGLSPSGGEDLSIRTIVHCDKDETMFSFDDTENKINLGVAIWRMSHGMPLTIICLSLLVVEWVQPQPDLRMLRITDELRDKVTTRALRGFLSVPRFKHLVESLYLSYQDLPLHLKTCLLHCSIYRPYQRFERYDLIRKWIVEGFVSEEDQAQNYFDELVSRGLIYRCVPGDTPFQLADYGLIKVHIYEINAMMLHFLRCKSQEYNFLTCLGKFSDIASLSARQIQRLSIQQDYGDSAALDLSHTRSLTVIEDKGRIPFKEFESLRVLDFQSDGHGRNTWDSLVEICGLILLRDLSLRGIEISELPPDIVRLQHLKILDVRFTMVRELPWEVGQLPKLERVIAPDEVKIPEGVCRTWITAVPDDSGSLLPELIKATDVRSVVILDHTGFIMGPLLVQELKVGSRRMHVPKWIGNKLFSNVPFIDLRVCKLEEADLKILREMPNLEVLALRLEVFPSKRIAIRGHGFLRLESFFLDCRLPRVTFQRGAMPNLKYLQFKFYSGPTSQDPMGITHLRSLVEVVFGCSENYRSDDPGISAIIEVVRKEAEEHANKITICINDKEEVFPRKNIAELIHEDNTVNGAGSSGASVIEKSADANDYADSKGKVVQAKNYESCARTSKIHEIEEVQE